MSRVFGIACVIMAGVATGDWAGFAFALLAYGFGASSVIPASAWAKVEELGTKPR